LLLADLFQLRFQDAKLLVALCNLNYFERKTLAATGTEARCGSVVRTDFEAGHACSFQARWWLQLITSVRMLSFRRYCVKPKLQEIQQLYHHQNCNNGSGELLLVGSSIFRSGNQFRRWLILVSYFFWQKGAPAYQSGLHYLWLQV
jgi:hypothetical protein